MQHDTNIGRGAGQFPTTRGSLLVAVRSGEPEARQRALDTLIAAYWKPVYKYIRLRWEKSNEESKDLTQEFFTQLLEKNYLERYDPKRARLRTFLRVCVDGLVANEWKSAHRLKRGGQAQFVSLDFESAEKDLPSIDLKDPRDVDEFFTREWVRSVFEMALDRLQQECQEKGKARHFHLFEFYDVDEGGKDLTYEQVAARLRLKTSDVTNYLAYARREFRQIVLEILRETTATDEEYRREALTLLGVEVP